MKKRKTAMLEALRKTLGVVTPACELTGIGRQTHYDWTMQDPVYKEAVESMADLAIDFAESKLHQNIKKGDTVATIFYLKTKGKNRGYVERIEEKGDINLTITRKVIKGGK